MSKSGKVWFPGPGWHLPSANKPVANHPWPVLRGLEHYANEAKIRLCPSQASIMGVVLCSPALACNPHLCSWDWGSGLERAVGTLCPQHLRGPELVHLPATG